MREPRGGVEQKAGNPKGLDADAISTGLGTRIVGRRVVVLHEVDSTNTEAMHLADGGASEGTVILAESQRAGRGRLGRSWESAPGLGLWTSVLLRPRVDPHLVPLISLLGAVSACEAINGSGYPIACRLKWPNDLMLGGRKVGGVLGEARFVGDHLRYIVLGIGLNVHHRPEHFSAKVREGATSLELTTGRRWNRTALARALYRRLDDWYLCYTTSAHLELLDRARSLCITIGSRLTVRSETEVCSAWGETIEADGALRVRLDDGRVRRITAGETGLSEWPGNPEE